MGNNNYLLNPKLADSSEQKKEDYSIGKLTDNSIEGRFRKLQTEIKAIRIKWMQYKKQYWR